MTHKEKFLKTFEFYQARWLTLSVVDFLLEVKKDPEILPVAATESVCLRSRRVKRIIRNNVRQHWQRLTGLSAIYFPYTVDAVGACYAFLCNADVSKSKYKPGDNDWAYMNPYYVMLAVIQVYRDNHKMAAITGMPAAHVDWTNNEHHKKDLQDRTRHAWVAVYRRQRYIFDFPFTRDAVAMLYYRVSRQKVTLIDKWETHLHAATKP